MQAATAELSVLIERAKHLLAHHDPTRSSTELQQLLGSMPYQQGRSDYNHSSPLPPIEDDAEEVSSNVPCARCWDSVNCFCFDVLGTTRIS